MSIYFVSTKHALVVGPHRIAPGERISEEALAKIKPKRLEQLLAQKAIFPPFKPEVAKAAEEPQSSEGVPEIPAGEVISAEAVPPPPPPKAPKTKQRWSLDPATLGGKTKEQLTVMALEVDPKAKPFESVEAGVKFLSQNFSK